MSTHLRAPLPTTTTTHTHTHHTTPHIRARCCSQFQGRAVFRHDLAMPLEHLLTSYCRWRGIDPGRVSFLWLQFYMRLHLGDTGLARGMDDGDTIYIYDKQVQDLRGTVFTAAACFAVSGHRGILWGSGTGCTGRQPASLSSLCVSKWGVHCYSNGSE